MNMKKVLFGGLLVLGACFAFDYFLVGNPIGLDSHLNQLKDGNVRDAGKDVVTTAYMSAATLFVLVVLGIGYFYDNVKDIVLKVISRKEKNEID